MSKVVRFAIIAGLLVLNSCGGGGDGESGAIGVVPGTTPTPTPTPTASPTPPAPTVYETAFDFTRDRSISAQIAEFYAIERPFEEGFIISAAGDALNADLSSNNITYVRATDALSVRYGSGLSTFEAKDITRRDDEILRYGRLTGPQTADLFQFVRPGLTYKYLGWAVQDIRTVEEKGDTPDQARALRVTGRAFQYGSQTAPADLPKTGLSRFPVTTTTSSVRPGGAYYQRWAAEGVLTVDHVTGAVTATLEAEEYLDGAVSKRTFTIAINGTLNTANGVISGTITSPNSDYSGRFSGALYGPTASELGLVFTTHGDDNQHVAGQISGLKAS